MKLCCVNLNRVLLFLFSLFFYLCCSTYSEAFREFAFKLFSLTLPNFFFFLSIFIFFHTSMLLSPLENSFKFLREHPCPSSIHSNLCSLRIIYFFLLHFAIIFWSFFLLNLMFYCFFSFVLYFHLF